MSIIYTPKGKALEYSNLAANLYKGCSHGCTYCYAPKATFTDYEKFISQEYIRPRPKVLEQLEKDAEKFSGSTEPILLSFTSDPYQPVEKTLKLTRHALLIFKRNGLKPQILTKAGKWAIERDVDLLSATDGIWAATLTSDSDQESLKWEPLAALPHDRIDALRFAKDSGLETWVSFEPVINPEAVLRLIDKTHSFVDLFKVGKLNHHPLEKEIDWAQFLHDVEKRLDKYGCKRYIKKDLEAYRSKIAA